MRHPSSKVCYIDHEVESVELLDWGQVFLDMGSSIIYEAIIRKKPVIELSFACSYITHVSRYFKKSDCRTRDQFVKILWEFVEVHQAGRDFDFYDQEELDLFYHELINPGDGPVLDRHVEFLRGI